MRCAPHAPILEIQLGVGLAMLPCGRSCVLGLGLLLNAFGSVSGSPGAHRSLRDFRLGANGSGWCQGLTFG
eukprot:16322356-Heterocapsa_arctica.AAC.1